MTDLYYAPRKGTKNITLNKLRTLLNINDWTSRIADTDDTEIKSISLIYNGDEMGLLQITLEKRNEVTFIDISDESDETALDHIFSVMDSIGYDDVNKGDNDNVNEMQGDTNNKEDKTETNEVKILKLEKLLKESEMVLAMTPDFQKEIIVAHRESLRKQLAVLKGEK